MADKKFVADSEIRNQAKRINSMSATLNKLENKVEGQQQIVSTTNKVLGKLAGAVEAATSSIEKVASNAVRYTKETLDQYSKQIGQDISVNKKNLMALSITQASPVFGYFVSKFFETEAFQNTMKKIKDGFITAIRSVVDKLRGIITGTWGGLKRVVGLKKKESFDEKIPKMAKGGYVSKGGLTRLHAAEVVMPIDKLLDRIDEKYEDKFNTMFKKFNIQQTDRVSKSVQKLDTSNRIYNREILESLVEIRVALAGYTKGFREWMSNIFQNFLLKHPAIRFLYSMGGWFMGKARGLINFPFTRRGGYKKFLSKDPNAFNATRDILNTTFVFSMERYDTIVQLLTQQLTATQDMASAFTGKKYKTALHKTYPEYTIAGAFMRLLGRGAKGIGKIAAWEYRSVKKMFGKGGKTGTHLPSQEISLSNITDKFGLLLDIQMKMLYTLKKCSSNILDNKNTSQESFKSEKSFQKKLLKSHYEERIETKKETTFLKKIEIGVFDLSNKMKGYVKKTGSYIWDGIKWIGLAIAGLATTIWDMVPDWLKTALGVGAAGYLGVEIGNAINTVMPDIVDTIQKAFSKKYILGGVEGGKTREQFELQDKMKKIEEKERISKLPLHKRMIEKMKWTDSLSEFQVPGQEELTGVERSQLKLIRLGSKFWKKFGIDPEIQIRNQVEQMREMNKEQEEERKHLRERLGIRQLKQYKKTMSPAALNLLDPKTPLGIGDRFFYLQQTGQILQDENKRWLAKDEYFTVKAPLLTKLEVGAFEEIGLGAQIKEARIHGLKAKEARDLQNKAFADSIKKKLTPEAYSMLTRFGNDNISEKFSSMVTNNQLLEYQGKLNTAYQYLDKTGKLSFEDRLKYIFGGRNIPPSDLINLLGIKASVYKEEAEYTMNDRINRELAMLHDPTMRYTDVLEKRAGAYSYADMMQAAEQDKATQDYLKSIKSENQPFSSQLSELGENFWSSLKENTSEMKETITPAIENLKIIGMEVKKEIAKQQAAMKTNEGIDNLGKRIKGIESAIITNMTNVNNAFDYSINNATRSSGQQNQSVASDPNIQSVLTGDLH